MNFDGETDAEAEADDSPISGVAADFAASDHEEFPLAVLAPKPKVSLMNFMSSFITPIPLTIPSHVCSYCHLSTRTDDHSLVVPVFQMC